jgi:integrative and conjugative element protein (TIGR02256 family)
VQRDIDQVFEESDGRLRYLGDWHTHPRDSARPSRVDANSAAEIAADSRVELPDPLVLIQATKPFHIHVGIGELAAYQWLADAGQLTTYELEVTTIDH